MIPSKKNISFENKTFSHKNRILSNIFYRFIGAGSTKAAKIQEIVRNWGVHKKFKTLAAIPSLHPAQDCIYYSNKLTVSASCPAKREKGSDSMKIERISENQLKLTLTKADLAERKIKLEDLISPSERTQKLFRDIMEQALDEEDFISENTPLMVEAIPSGGDGIMIIVTKVNNKEKHADEDLRRWKKKPMDTLAHEEEKNSDILIYSFPSLDDVIGVSLRLDGVFKGESAVYKNDGKYFLVMQGDTYTTEETAEDAERILKEYGQKHISTPLAKYYLLEHGETLLAEQAIKALAKTFR